MRANAALADSSVLVSAALTAGPARRLLELARQGTVQLWVSTIILEETRRSLLKPKLRAHYRHAAIGVDRFCAGIRRVAQVVTDLPPVPPTCRDPNDDHVLAAAPAPQAEIVVTGDRDLLALARFRGIEIPTAKAFPARLKAPGPSRRP